MQNTLPIDPILPQLISTLQAHGHAVLQAPPGAGKTTRVPLALMEAGVIDGKILMLEPRRIATRAAAHRIADSVGETPGIRIGYRMRGASVSGDKVEVVTEGILTRMIQSDPELTGIRAVIFDEFHERSLHADLGLALTLEVREALRPDLKLLVMSATLDASPVAEYMGNAPILTSAGRAFPVSIHHLERPVAKNRRFEDALVDLIHQAIGETSGGVLVFLPGEGEIRRVEARLAPSLPSDCHIAPLFGALPFEKQQQAIKPRRAGRKIVLATSIAETSLTIEDVRVVIDGGLARRARFDPGSGMSRLVTERVSRAEAAQRQGRAGRVAEGVCYKLWTKGEEGALPPFPPAEIEAADLAPLALELAQWGAESVRFLTPPPPATLAESRALLKSLGALDGENRITPHGTQIARIPVHPRLAHMLIKAGEPAAKIAALLEGREFLKDAGVDLSLRLRVLNGGAAPEANKRIISDIKAEAKRLTKFGNQNHAAYSVAEMVALAYPDRIAMRRPGNAPRYLMSGGKGAYLPDGDGLAGQRLLVITDTDGHQTEAKIRTAIAISETELRTIYAPKIKWHNICKWSRREHKVIARKQEKFGAIILNDQIWKDAPPDDIARAMLEGVRELGLFPSAKANRFRARVSICPGMPDMSDQALLESLDDWLLPYLGGVKTADDWKAFEILPALQAMLTWDQQQTLDREVPSGFTTPLGRNVPIDYSGDDPEIAVRLQELFGVTEHPTVSGRPLRVTLLSPAGRPLQTTMDLPGFWASSYADVRKDMRGRYPKHPWPEDPTVADPTLRAKRRRV